MTNRLRVCEEAQEANKRPGMTFACLARRHFLPEVAESSPYESVAQAVIAWVQEEPNRYVAFYFIFLYCTEAGLKLSGFQDLLKAVHVFVAVVSLPQLLHSQLL